MHRLEGLNISVSNDCNGCGRCEKACFAGAIMIKNNRATITDECKGCGICADKCPENAMEITVSDGDRMLQAAYRRIESYADVT